MIMLLHKPEVRGVAVPVVYQRSEVAEAEAQAARNIEK
jgi:hypothetical protein